MSGLNGWVCVWAGLAVVNAVDAYRHAAARDWLALSWAAGFTVFSALMAIRHWGER